ncbi:hypothetical protein Vretimale_14753 [Volvox reticuliferus]|uniref:PNPLA domain-containing protein n=1 Tax=Volvox reticuliferus TaxID=1737510 RepID=A0A8J4LV05_9CHLO|nr:hypothetical protein Vretifemale_15606 [Volvox reticuliferus]GIM11204.1 hypothetical protein Vretimale_14753 [Volvox reticuliferus]
MTLLKWIHRCNSFTNEHLSVAIKNRRDSKGMQQVIAAQRSPGSASNKTAALHIVWPGFGTCFFWQAGIMSRLSEEFRMAHVPTIASSGGGLVAVLGACEVPPAEAVRLAFRLCREAGVYDRPMGLLGIWRNLVHRWLDGLLPADAASRCTHVRLVVTELPSLQPLQVRGTLVRVPTNPVRLLWLGFWLNPAFLLPFAPFSMKAFPSGRACGPCAAVLTPSAQPLSLLLPLPFSYAAFPVVRLIPSYIRTICLCLAGYFLFDLFSIFPRFLFPPPFSPLPIP